MCEQILQQLLLLDAIILFYVCWLFNLYFIIYFLKSIYVEVKKEKRNEKKN